MARKRFSAEEIVRILRTIEVDSSKGMSIEACCRKAGISDVTYHRWKKEYGGLRVDQAKRMKEIEQENTSLHACGLVRARIADDLNPGQAVVAINDATSANHVAKINSAELLLQRLGSGNGVSMRPMPTRKVPLVAVLRTLPPLWVNVVLKEITLGKDDCWIINLDALDEVFRQNRRREHFVERINFPNPGVAHGFDACEDVAYEDLTRKPTI